MTHLPAFEELFAKWLRALFSELNKRRRYRPVKYRYIGDYYMDERDSDFHAFLGFDKKRFTPTEDPEEPSLAKLRISVILRHPDLIDAFAKHNLSTTFQVDVVATLNYDTYYENGIRYEDIDPCIDVFNSPVTPVFYDAGGDEIGQLSAEVTEAISPALTWSLLLSVCDDTNKEG